MYKVKEIFRSIQGEGFFTGKEAIFLRFSGCNLWNGLIESRANSLCNFCDTDFRGTNGKNGGSYSLNDLLEILEKIWKSRFSLSKKFIILTGGEPLLQVDQKLVKALKDCQYYVAVETNGTIKTGLDFDWISVSPKENARWNQKTGDELKIVYPQNKFDLKKITNLKFKYFFLQPKEDHIRRINISKTIEYCKNHKPWFPSFQIHKILGVN